MAAFDAVKHMFGSPQLAVRQRGSVFSAGGVACGSVILKTFGPISKRLVLLLMFIFDTYVV